MQSKIKTALCFDYGTKSIGLAVGQTVTKQASPLAAVKAKDGTPEWRAIEMLIQEWQPDLLVVGLPLNMDGSDQPFTARTRKFANRLHGRFGLPIVLQDERLTTASAREDLFAAGGYRNLEKGKVDSEAAKQILEMWLAEQQ